MTRAKFNAPPEEAAHYGAVFWKRRRSSSLATRELANLEAIRRWTMDTVEPLYRLLDVQFDCVSRRELLQPHARRCRRIIAQTAARHGEQRAPIVMFLREPVEGEERRAEAVIRKKDGALHLHDFRPGHYSSIGSKEWNPGAILYVVGSPQSHHFKTLFEAARRWGYRRRGIAAHRVRSVLGTIAGAFPRNTAARPL